MNETHSHSLRWLNTSIYLVEEGSRGPDFQGRITTKLVFSTDHMTQDAHLQVSLWAEKVLNNNSSRITKRYE